MYLTTYLGSQPSFWRYRALVTSELRNSPRRDDAGAIYRPPFRGRLRERETRFPDPSSGGARDIQGCMCTSTEEVLAERGRVCVRIIRHKCDQSKFTSNINRNGP